ncbi:uncharacterized protein JN550_011761 [Neoarthrinium moseri]|uniref:uncharacterized protein n=1 Tax=Neoarthrinium moseri TaxID=1658444 RepID=UPI001FDD0EDA|nr:uncharacterized protein JN550_011761 [Neoarthrinium moseri]KAI1859950.1 hypothetical protein JN550_011761 [Neoarthrinium moseri]
MFAASPVVELAGSRTMACRGPRGTAPPALALRVRRWPQPGSTGRHAGLRAGAATRPSLTTGICRRFGLNHEARRAAPTWAASSSRHSGFTPEDAMLLDTLIRSQERRVLRDGDIVTSHVGASGALPSGTSAAMSVHGPKYQGEQTERLIAALPTPFQNALQAMQQQDSRRLLFYLHQIVAMPEDEMVAAVQTIPRTTFSEFLRSLDPLDVVPENDPTHGVHINPGLWMVLNMGAIIDEWGVRVLYARLLRQMLTLMRALHASGSVLNVNDYVPLLRAAGASSDVAVVKLLWGQMIEHGISYWRQGSIYNEFVKARLLVEPAYFGFDKTRLAMTARNLHRRGRVRLHAETIGGLDRLRLATRQRSYRFGLNKNIPHAEDLSRIMRKPRSATRMFYYIQHWGFHVTERLLCSLMRGFGRAGALRFIQYRILEDYFAITVRQNKRCDEVYVGPTPPRTTPHKDPLRARAPTMKPSARLMEAVIDVYCSNGYLSTAFTIVDYLSSKHRIPISPKAWFELFEWTYVLSSPAVSTGWNYVGFRQRIPSTDAVEMIWNTMTSPPYKVEPGFKQYDLLIRSLLGQSKIHQAMKYMESARKFHQKQCADCESAALEYTGARQTGVDATAALRRFQRARFLKEYMWHRMNGWCNDLLKHKWRPKELHDGSRWIPDVIRDWRDFIRNPVQYRTATGFVEMYDPAEEIPEWIHVRDDTLRVPVREGGETHLAEIHQAQYRVASKHSVGNLMSTRLSPLAILKGDLIKARKRTRRGRLYLARQAERLTAMSDERISSASTFSGQGDGPDGEDQGEADNWDDDDW